MYCSVLYCSVLYYTVLYCTVLYCTVLYFTVLYLTVLYCNVIYFNVAYCTVIDCTQLYYNLSSCTLLYYTCIVQYCTVPRLGTIFCMNGISKTIDGVRFNDVFHIQIKNFWTNADIFFKKWQSLHFCSKSFSYYILLTFSKYFYW